MNEQRNSDREATDHDFADEFVNTPTPQEHLTLDDLEEVALELAADIGKCVVSVRDILELKEGTVLPLDKIAGEMADVFINGIPFARGEVVVLVDSLNIRLAEIIGATEQDLEDE